MTNNSIFKVIKILSFISIGVLITGIIFIWTYNYYDFQKIGQNINENSVKIAWGISEFFILLLWIFISIILFNNAIISTIIAINFNLLQNKTNDPKNVVIISMLFSIFDIISIFFMIVMAIDSTIITRIVFILFSVYQLAYIVLKIVLGIKCLKNNKEIV